MDFASLYLMDTILQDDCNGYFQSLYNTEILKHHKYSASIRSAYIFHFVPGWVYQSETENGADLSRPRAVIDNKGFETHLLKVDETGTIEDNAHKILAITDKFAKYNKKVILVSVSVGGASVLLHALNTLRQSEFRHNIAAWVNISGLLQGSHLADIATHAPAKWVVKSALYFKGWNYASVESMTTDRSRRRYSNAALPDNLLVVNYIGIPLSGSITDRAKNGYFELSKEGPNDGLTLIVDEISPRSVTIMELGLDHFFRDPKIERKTAALLQLLIKTVERLDKSITRQSDKSDKLLQYCATRAINMGL